MSFSPEEVEEFKSDAMEMLDSAERDLLALDKGGDFKSIYDSIFRVFHSLKGAAGMMSLDAPQEHFHNLENLFCQCKNSSDDLRSNINFFLDGVDAARRLIANESVSFKYALPHPPGSAPAAQPAPANTTATGKAPKISDASRVPPILAYAVDDEKDILDYVTEVLQLAKIQVKSFLQPEDLLAEVKKHTPDVVLTDMMMPKMNGMEMLREIRKIDNELPLIFVSAHLSKKVLLDAIQNGVFAAIEKPFQDSVLISQCLAAGRQYQLNRLLNRSVKLLMYQYSDLDDFLASQGKHEIRANIKSEIENLLELRKQLKNVVSESH